MTQNSEPLLKNSPKSQGAMSQIQLKALETLYNGFSEIREAVNKGSLERVMSLSLALHNIPEVMGGIERGNPCDDELLSRLIVEADNLIEDESWLDSVRLK